MAFNILVVDDSETMRAVIKKTVILSGVQIGEFREAGNGREALQVLEESWMDVVLSDINMPEMGGIEFLRRVKQNEVLRNIPIIFISTESSQTRIDEVTGLGAAAYVKKPFMPEKIKVILLDVLTQAYASRMVAEGSVPTSGAGVEADF